jgi:hypothetical protein
MRGRAAHENNPTKRPVSGFELFEHKAHEDHEEEKSAKRFSCPRSLQSSANDLLLFVSLVSLVLK